MPCNCDQQLGVVPAYFYPPQRQSIGAWRNVNPDRRDTIVAHRAIDPATILRLRDGDPRRVAEDIRRGISQTVARPTNLGSLRMGAIAPAWLGAAPGVGPLAVEAVEAQSKLTLPAPTESQTNWGLAVAMVVIAILAVSAGASDAA